MAKRTTKVRFLDCLSRHFKIVEVSTLSDKSMLIECMLETSDFSVTLSIKYGSDIRRRPPEVSCSESWIKKETNWHCGSDGSLCWIKEQLWKKLHGSPKKKTFLVYEEGALQLYNDVRSLIEKHYYAKMTGITEWQEEWDEWGHYRQGDIEYANETDNGNHLPSNCEIIDNERIDR